MLVFNHLIFSPSEELSNLAVEFGREGEYIFDPAVWTVRVHDRTGCEYSVGEVEESFWVVFLAQLFEEAPESIRVMQFRERCIALGFRGCWSVRVTKNGGPAQELVEESEGARKFVVRNGLASV